MKSKWKSIYNKAPVPATAPRLRPRTCSASSSCKKRTTWRRPTRPDTPGTSRTCSPPPPTRCWTWTSSGRSPRWRRWSGACPAWTSSASPTCSRCPTARTDPPRLTTPWSTSCSASCPPAPRATPGSRCVRGAAWSFLGLCFSRPENPFEMTK